MRIPQALPERELECAHALDKGTMQACRYLFDASGVLFVIAADWKYRTIVYMQV